MKAAVIYATYGHWTQSLLNAGYKVAFHWQPSLKDDPELVYRLSDPVAHQILKTNFPQVEFKPPSSNDKAYDLVAGSPPCVGFSRTNPKARPDHPLNKHTINFFKWVLLNGPRYFLMEMVPGILKSQDPTQGAGIFNQCLRMAMEEYRVDYQVMEASEYGAAQKRERLYIWGSRRDNEPLESPLASLPKKDYTPIKAVLNSQTIDFWDQFSPDGKYLLDLHRKDGEMIAGAWGSLRPDKIKNRTLKPDGLMFTITSTSIRDCLHYSTKRLLSIAELKVLMGFPSTYYLPLLHVGLASKMIASGVDIRFASYLLTHIREELEYQEAWNK